jgi:hypothetical protein
MAMPDAPLADIEAEARRILDAAGSRGDVVRILGGIAIAMLACRPIPEPLRRSYADIDLMVPRGAGGKATALLEELGYEANRRFNSLHGATRLLFYDTANTRQLDIFVGAFKMCHELSLDKRLDVVPRTLAPADLLLTKLQIVQVNAKDLSDAASLLYECEVGETDAAETINLRRLTGVLSGDWGWYTTVTDNLSKTAELARERLTPEDAGVVVGNIETITAAAENAPKSMSWKIRSRVGRRVQWYELPEEVDR